jgi:RNA polymerase sigma factor for flagellar operon FliA
MPPRKEEQTRGKGATRDNRRGDSFSDETQRRNALVEEYRGYVKVVVARLIRTMGLPLALKDDFIASAYVGLIEAAARFDSSRGMEFRYYAYLRIRGAVIDHIRVACELSGHAFRKFRALEVVHEMRQREVEAKLSGKAPEVSAPTATEVLERSAVALKLAAALDGETAAAHQELQNPERVLQRKREAKKMRAIVATLPEKERTIIEQYYFHDRKFIEVAEQFSGLSKSWVSRLHDRALDLLREKLRGGVSELAA